jgi:hypothetical protein
MTPPNLWPETHINLCAIVLASLAWLPVLAAVAAYLWWPR